LTSHLRRWKYCDALFAMMPLSLSFEDFEFFPSLCLLRPFWASWVASGSSKLSLVFFGSFLDRIPTPTVLELEEISNIKPEGIVEHVIVSLDSWNYPVDFMTLQLKYGLGGNSLILGRTWLATTNAYISCHLWKYNNHKWLWGETNPTLSPT